MKKRILCAVGTRPEAIKMAPLVYFLRKHSYLDLKVLSTSQHREMLDQMLKVFDIVPDMDLDVMKHGQSLAELTSCLPIPLHHALQQIRPDFILAQGDTTTAFMVSLAAFYQKIPFGHVEAGLRTGDLHDPFPEEMNRCLISRLATLHFAPTEAAKQNLLREGVPAGNIFLTGNTVIDALHLVLKGDSPFPYPLETGLKLIIVTAHRRENWGPKLEGICQGLKRFVAQNPGVQVLFPVHPNPQVSAPVYRWLANIPRIMLTAPLPYKEFVKAMKLSYFIISDSGGIQEEAPALGKPVLVIRDTTERPEGVLNGSSKVIGTHPDSLVKEAEQLLNNQDSYARMAAGGAFYGDGSAASRIASTVIHYLGIEELSFAGS